MDIRSVLPQASVELFRTGFCCFLTFLPASEHVLSQRADTVVSVAFQGNRFISSAALSEAVAPLVGVRYSREALEKALNQLLETYAAKGYLHVSIDSVSKTRDEVRNTVALTFCVDEGKPSLVTAFTFEGNETLAAAELSASIGGAERGALTRSAIESAVRSVLGRYEQTGHPFAKVAVSNIEFEEQPDHHAATVALTIDEGPAVRIDEFTIVGNSTTRRDVILRAARFQPGQAFDGDLPRKVKRRLERLQVFSSVSMPQIYWSAANTGGLRVEVREGSPNRFDGVVGYVPASRPQESGYFTGLVDIQLRNLFGTARRFGARWFRESQSTHEIELRYREPWVASLPVDAEGAFLQRKQDSSYVRRFYEAGVDVALGDEFRIGGMLSLSSVVPTESVGAPRVAESRTRLAGLSLLYDAREDPVTPTSGILYRTEYRVGVKQRTVAGSGQSNSLQNLLLDVEYYLPVLLNQVVAAALHVRDVRVSDIELSDLLRIGGASTVRGYREGEFLGSRAIWMNLEYRVLVGGRSFAYAFVDGARVETPPSLSTIIGVTDQTNVGYGAGIRVDTALGLIGVSVALAAGDAVSNAKLHLRLINEF
jgi:outer membrane protein insertion porin family